MDKHLIGKVELKKKGEVGIVNSINISTRILAQKRRTFVRFIGTLHEEKVVQQPTKRDGDDSKLSRKSTTTKSDVDGRSPKEGSSAGRKHMRYF